MRARQAAIVAFALSFAGIVLASGCKDATQATLEVRMIKSDLCPTTGGTALAVGADRADVETRITSYVTAETRDCDVKTGTIGSLVVTPGEGGRSAVVVVVAVDTKRARTATDCKPPAYAGCVVARRFFAFSDHKNLRIPISIDPECVDVPCNATSTCRKGNCYDSTSDNGIEPGDDGQGGTTEAGIVDGAADGFTPDSSTNDGGPDGAIPDGGSDADGGTLPPKGECKGTKLFCYASNVLVSCAKADNGTNACCDASGKTAQCNPSGGCLAADRYCCDDTDCDQVAGQHCKNQTATTPGRCFLGEPPNCPNKATGPLYCPMAPCTAGMTACCSTGASASCMASCGGQTQWCCEDADCGGGGGPVARCVRDKTTTSAGTCGLKAEL